MEKSDKTLASDNPLLWVVTYSASMAPRQRKTFIVDAALTSHSFITPEEAQNAINDLGLRSV